MFKFWFSLAVLEPIGASTGGLFPGLGVGDGEGVGVGVGVGLLPPVDKHVAVLDTFAIEFTLCVEKVLALATKVGHIINCSAPEHESWFDPILWPTS